jgi:hypothetical protein
MCGPFLRQSGPTLDEIFRIDRAQCRAGFALPDQESNARKVTMPKISSSNATPIADCTRCDIAPAPSCLATAPQRRAALGRGGLMGSVSISFVKNVHGRGDPGSSGRRGDQDLETGKTQRARLFVVKAEQIAQSPQTARAAAASAAERAGGLSRSALPG